jgi:hypothetical protein
VVCGERGHESDGARADDEDLFAGDEVGDMQAVDGYRERFGEGAELVVDGVREAVEGVGGDADVLREGSGDAHEAATGAEVVAAREAGGAGAAGAKGLDRHAIADDQPLRLAEGCDLARIRGRADAGWVGNWPLKWRSVPQIPQARTLSKISPGAGAGSSAWRTSMVSLPVQNAAIMRRF